MIKDIILGYIRFSITFGVVYTFITSRNKTGPLRCKDGSLDKAWGLRWFILSVIIWPYFVIMALWWDVKYLIQGHKNRRKR